MDIIIGRIQKLFEQKLEKAENKDERLYFVLYKSIRRGIVRSEIPQECKLPASRKLARALNVSRSTVNKAYELLGFEGYTQTKVGSGSVVKSAQNKKLKKPKIQSKYDYPELSVKGNSFLNNVSLINSTNDQNIAFRPGVPPLDIFPVNQWKNLSNLYWRNIKSLALSYSASSGNEQLKQSIATYLNLSRKIKCSSRQVIIVSGSLQSLYLIGNTLVNPGDKVVMENPTFPNVISIFKSLGAKLIGKALDEEGISIKSLRTSDSRKAKILHLTPSSHYPTGVRMSIKRRREVLNWADENGSIIIENDYEHEVNNYEEELPTLYSMDTQQRTIYLSTFNRLLHPSIRLGFMVVPPYLLEAVEALLNHSHRFVATSIQVVFRQFMEQKRLYDHVKQINEVAKHRKEVFKQSFYEHFGDQLTLRETHAPSLHLYVEFDEKEDINDVELVKQISRYNVLVHSYSKCFIGDNKRQGLIFGYSSVRDPVIRNRVAQMHRAYLEYKKENWYA